MPDVITIIINKYYHASVILLTKTPQLVVDVTFVVDV